MDRKVLAGLLAERTGLAPREARRVLDELLGRRQAPGLLAELLVRHGRLQLAGFGTFVLRPDRRLAREPLLPGFPPPRRVAFRPARLLRDLVE